MEGRGTERAGQPAGLVGRVRGGTDVSPEPAPADSPCDPGQLVTSLACFLICKMALVDTALLHNFSIAI